MRSVCNHHSEIFRHHRINNISEKYPRRIGQGLNDVSCILGSMSSSLVGLLNPAWVCLGNFVSHMADCTHIHARTRTHTHTTDAIRL